MKKILKSKFACLSAIAALGAGTLLAVQPVVKSHGTDILHFFVRKTMTNQGIESGATGSVNAKQNKQGHANNQQLDILVKGLTTNTTYQLLALIDDDTNQTQVAEFTTDDNGNAALRYRKMGNGNGNGHGNGGGLGHGKSPLPGALDPLSSIRELTIQNGSTQAVLTADLTSPDKLQYLVKRDLSTSTVDAALRIKATTSETQFRLIASGLNPTNDYLLVLNGGIAETDTTDENGKLVISSLLQNPGDILDCTASRCGTASATWC